MERHVPRGGGSRLAFTLAEVLITLGIIGVGAAMTLPTVINKYRGYVLGQQFKKSYSNLSQVIIDMKKDLGIDGFKSNFVILSADQKYYDSVALNTFYTEFDKHINYVKELSNSYPVTNYSGTVTFTSVGGGDFTCPTYILPDGSSFGRNVNMNRIRLYIDTNGPYKKPNRYGFDIFEFVITDNTDLVKPLKPLKTDYTDEELEKLNYMAGFPCTKRSKQQLNGIGCSWYAINNISPDNENKKYWDNLPW